MERKENYQKLKRKLILELLFSITIFVVSLIPFIINYWLGTPIGGEVEVTYINALITASGIIFGFLSAASISKSEYLESFHFNLIRFDLYIFIVAIIIVTNAMIRGSLTVFELLCVQSSLMLNGLTAIITLSKVFGETQIRKFRGRPP